MSITAQITNGFHSILDSLSEKEKSIIMRRIGFDGTKETLQEIGNRYGITRERVRQIEDVGIRKIGRIIRTTDLILIQNSGNKILKMHGGVMTRDRLINAIIADIGVEATINHNIIDILLQADFNIQKSKPQLGTNAYFHFPDITKKMIESIHKEGVKILKKRDDIMECSTLYDAIRTNLFAQFGKLEPIMIDSIMDIFLDVIK